MQAWLSLEFGAAARKPDGRTNGAAKPASAVARKKRRRDKGREGESMVEERGRGLVFIRKAEHGLPNDKLKRDSCREF
jgi:hypothetical protein